jgi:maltose alpha-D-glucosyltransferase/alpha-amylase
LLRIVEGSSETQDLRQHLGAQWLRETRQAFLESYEQGATAAGQPAIAPLGDGLLELFLLEKAVYELKYEVENRPDWVRIPLRGLLDLLDTKK